GRLATLGGAPAQLELLGRRRYGTGADLLEVQARQVEGGTAKISMGSLGADGRSLLVKNFSAAHRYNVVAGRRVPQVVPNSPSPVRNSPNWGMCDCRGD